jgi:hypothetical protein
MIASPMSKRVLTLLAFVFLALAPAAARSAVIAPPPTLSAWQRGAVIARVTVDTYGVTKPDIAQRYLSLHAGDRLTQAGLDRDYANLIRLADYIPRVEISPGGDVGSVRVRWILMSKWLKPTSHPFYGDQPLSAPIQGVGFILTAPPLNSKGGAFSAYTQLSRRANLARALYTQPLSFDPKHGTATSLIVDEFGGRGVYRASKPQAINVYSWTAGQEALLLRNSTNGTQVEVGVRAQRTTDQLPSSIVAPTLYPTYVHPAHNTELLAGVSHACTSGPNRWYPPFCTQQYRFSITDAVGGFGSTNQFRIYAGDVVRYINVGSSTLALHASGVFSGGVLPDSFLLCATVRGYPKPFCGTDAEGVTAEYRIDDHRNKPLQFVLFTETAASRVRGSLVPEIASPNFTWHPDSGIGVIYRLVRFDLAFGNQGARLTFELKGQLF